MNLHGIASQYVGAVNPLIPVTVEVSVGAGTTGADGSRPPLYATPGSIIASIGGSFMATASGTMLSVAAVIQGSLQPGDSVSGTDGVNSIPPGTTISSQLTGPPGGVGTYELSGPATLNSCTVTAVSTVLNVTAVASGVLQPGQALADIAAALLPNTSITGLLGGVGGPGTYTVSQPQTVASETMTTTYPLLAEIQPIGWRDLQQLDGLNLGGVRWKAYLHGEVDAVVRPEKKGGDLLLIPPTSRHAGTWLVAQILEQWPDWCCAAITLQNGA